MADGDGCSSICEIEAATECTDVSLDNYQAAGKWVSWEISNTSGQPIVIDTIEINWPLDMEELFKIKLDHFNIWLGAETIPPTTINSGWIGDEDDRTIGVGMTEVIDFEFTINVDPTGFSTSISFPVLNCYASDTQ